MTITSELVSDQATGMLYSRLTIELDVEYCHTGPYDRELFREGIMELLRLDNAIHNKLTADEIIKFKQIK